MGALEDVLAAGFVGVFILDRGLRRNWRLPQGWALGLLLAMGALVAVYLAYNYSLEFRRQVLAVRQGHGQVHPALRLPRRGHATRHRPWRARCLRRTIGAFVLGLAINCAYGVVEFAAQVGAGVNLDKAVIGPLTFGQGSLGGINVYGQATAVQSSTTSRSASIAWNALALDPDRLGIMLCIPILLLLPFALRAGLRRRTAAASCSPRCSPASWP